MKQTCYRLEKGKYLTVIPCADLPAEGDGDSEQVRLLGIDPFLDKALRPELYQIQL